MKKKLAAAVLTTVVALSMSMTAFAGQWVNTGDWSWKWMNDDGSCIVNAWAWLDGNGDGIAECYYFGSDGIMYHCNRTPDGYAVNHEGAWCQGGAVMTKSTR